MRMALVSIHDVTPVMEEQSRRVVELVTGHCGHDLTLLVVPDYRSQGDLTRHPEFCSWLKHLHEMGVEIAQHGLTHTGSPEAKDFGSRFLTAGEGEFAVLGRKTALERIRRGREIFTEALGFPPAGFTAPAWLYSRGTVEALTKMDFPWIEYRSGVRYGGGRKKISPVVVFASRTPWKRFCSLVWASISPACFSLSGTVRIAAHVRDVPSLEVALQRVLRGLRPGRRCLTVGAGALD